MSKTFNLYCDESCHLENDGMPYMLIAYVSSAYNQVKLHQANIRALREKHKCFGEIKWTKVSKSQAQFYLEVVEYFFSSDLQFRAIVVAKEKVSTDNFDDFYYKMYYQLLHHKINMDYNYNVYLDIKDTLSAWKVKRLKEILNLKYSSICTVQNIRSHESVLMQLTDLLMGAIGYYLRGDDKVIAKNNIIEKISAHAKFPLDRSTPKSSDKFNLFFIDLQ
ncbi:DUF3800 domain-containing protein [Parapedobacter koreensis]|uniref:DUF3800 domain-containing protein n=1 Tax=Parapedobacter koreensis TaxID=332977 RepID=A0A1H7NJB3_9SPHI|nr:DUF3800 domain-containing protein [Parapedobacter koreensis]SEL23593.1 Protein of unknown function [Parapedobacter koreensis]